MSLGFLGSLLYVTGVLAVVAGLLTQSKELLAAASVAGGLGYAIRDYFGRTRDSVTVMTFYAGGSAFWFGVGNLAAYVLVDTPFAARFYRYEAPDFIFEAQLIGTLATFVPTLAYDWMGFQAKGPRLVPRLASVGVPLANRDVVIWCLILVGLDWAARLGAFIVPNLGTISVLVATGSNIAVFVLTLLWVEQPPPRSRRDLVLPATIMIASVTYSFLFDLLRSNMLFSVGGFLLPFLLRKAMDLRATALSAVFAMAFILVFEPLGQTRREAYGTGRLAAVASQVREPDREFDDYGATPLLARLSTFNQLSQVVAITHTEGFYEGRTLEYLLYVFVPRAIWPEKPTIAPGRWFAEKLGRGSYREGLGFSNAINMTIPGELYLNFGWLGTIVGVGLMGVLYYLFWESAAALRHTSDLVAGGFGLTLLNQAMFGGSHFGGVVNIVIWYLMALFTTWALRPKGRKGHARPVGPALRERALLVRSPIAPPRD